VSTVRQITAPGEASGDDLKYIVDAARDALEQEVGRAERYDAKARNQMTLAGSWFAVVQAVAAVAIRPNTPSKWVVGILLAAVVAAGGLILAMIASAKVWKLREQPAVNHETLNEMLDDARRKPSTFGEDLVQLYRNLLGHAQERNDERADALDESTRTWWWALSLGFIELAVALLSRVSGG
jgi:uncharacterized protein YneF (UPF0154 family)